MRGRQMVVAFERAVPSQWDVKTGDVNQGAAAWAMSPNKQWELQLVRNPNPGARGGYNVELYDGSGGLYNGTTVHNRADVGSAVRRFIEEITGSTHRSNRASRVPPSSGRRGRVEDDAGLFDQLG